MSVLMVIGQVGLALGSAMVGIVLGFAVLRLLGVNRRFFQD